MARHRLLDHKRSGKPYLTIGGHGVMVYHFTVHVFNGRELIPHILKAHARSPL